MNAQWATVVVASVGLAWGAAVGAPPVAAATVTPPDLKILVPGNLISIGVDASSGHRMLRYTHITEDAGTGPFELEPSYNAATGIASFVQTIYSSSGPGVWTVDHTVPIAVNGAFVNGSDYRFPLTAFSLHTVNADGSVGAAVATSPKTDYCMTGDNRVGDVPNTPTQTSPPASNCNDPTLPLGWSVGWGDQYDQTDSGQPIDISSLSDGTYVLRATVDPQHVLSESDATNNVTDTRLTITGTAVVVGAQTHPSITPPTVAVTNPLPGSTVSGTVNLTASASAASGATVTSVQYLLDGNPLGGAQTTAPYSYAWTIGSTAPGAHRLAAQATDSAGTVSTSAVVSVNVPASGGGGPSQTVTQNGNGTTVTAPFSTPSGQTLVALVGSDGPPTSGGQSVTVSGAGLSWKRVVAANSQYGDSEIWEATTANALSAATVTSTPSASNYDQQLTVLVIPGTAGVGASVPASAPTGSPTVTLTSTTAGSSFYAVGNDWDTATGRTVGPGQAIVSQWADPTSGDTYWAQKVSAVGTTSGQSVTLNDTAPTADRWNLAAVEVLPTGSSTPPPPDTTPPTVTITNPAAGQTVSGTTTVAATATDNTAVTSVQFLLDGQPLGSPLTTMPYATAWNTTLSAAGSHTLTARAVDPSGNVGTSLPVTVTVQNPAPPMTCFVLQVQKSAHGTSAVTTPTFSTAMTGEVLVAFVASDGPPTSAGQSAVVSGAGLTWTLVKRANAQYGDSEVWTATAPTILSNAKVTSSPAKNGYHQDLTVIAMEGASGVGAAVAGSSSSGAAGVSLTTTAPTSLVFAVGNDWDHAAARTLPTGQVLLDQWVDGQAADTYWSEYTNQTTGAAGTMVKIGTTGPTTDRWNLAAVELKNGG